MRSLPGDWIIKGVAGEFYSCRSAIFEATYDKVEGGFYEDDEPVEKIVAAFERGQDFLHPDWEGGEYDTPLYDFKEALGVASQYAATIPASVLTPTVSLKDVDRVLAYRATYSSEEPWEPGQYTGTELDLKVLFRLKDGRWGFLTGWNDYTGWGCQDGADLRVGDFSQIRSTATSDDRVWLDLIPVV